MKQISHPLPPTPPVRLSNAAAWKFSLRIFESLIWHRNTLGKLIVHKTPPVAAAVMFGVCTAISGPGAGAVTTVAAVAAFAALAVPAVRLDFRKGNSPYTNAEQTAVLVVKTEKDGAWKPDLHVKLKRLSSEDVAAFRIDTMVRVLRAADDHNVSLKLTPRDARLYGRYLRDLIAAQNILGIPREQRRRVVVAGRAFPRGFHCMVPPVPSGAPSAPPSPPSSANGPQGRMPIGIPVGGQFAAHTHAEPGIVLPERPGPQSPDDVT